MFGFSRLSGRTVQQKKYRLKSGNCAFKALTDWLKWRIMDLYQNRSPGAAMQEMQQRLQEHDKDQWEPISPEKSSPDSMRLKPGNRGRTVFPSGAEAPDLFGIYPSFDPKGVNRLSREGGVPYPFGYGLFMSTEARYMCRSQPSAAPVSGVTATGGVGAREAGTRADVRPALRF